MVGLWVNVYRMINLNGAQEIEIRKINLAKQTEGSEKGLILEVDLEYPDELHEIIDDYPLAAEKNRCDKRHAFKLLWRNKTQIQYINGSCQKAGSIIKWQRKVCTYLKKTRVISWFGVRLKRFIEHYDAISRRGWNST